MRTHRWEDLKAKCAPETIARAEQHTRLLVAAIELDSIRRARRIRHSRLSARIARQAEESFSRNRREGPTLAALRQVVEAMGGMLRVTAQFPDAEYDLDSIGREEVETV